MLSTVIVHIMDDRSERQWILSIIRSGFAREYIIKASFTKHQSSQLTLWSISGLMSRDLFRQWKSISCLKINNRFMISRSRKVLSSDLYHHHMFHISMACRKAPLYDRMPTYDRGNACQLYTMLTWVWILDPYIHLIWYAYCLRDYRHLFRKVLPMKVFSCFHS